MQPTCSPELRSERGHLWPSLLLALAGCVITYWLLDFVLTPNTLSPVHHDDYGLLGSGWENLHWFAERPVSTNLTYVMGALGPAFSFALQNSLVVLIPAAVLVFAFGLLRAPMNLALALGFGVMVFAHASALEHGKYLGLITNLSSHFFGMASLFALLWIWRRPGVGRLTAGVAAYALTAFAKEDFLLPPLILLAYFGAALYFPRSGQAFVDAELVARKRWWWTTVCAFFAVGLATAAYSALVKSPFTAGVFNSVGAASPYAANFSPASLLAGFFKLTAGYALAQSIAGLFAFAVLFAGWRDRRREVLVLAAITVSIVLPYSVIINQAPPYRAFAWLPWLTAPVLAVVALLWRRFDAVGPSLAARIAAVALFAVPWIIAHQDHRMGLAVGEWYANQQRANEDMLRTVQSLRPVLVQQQTVGLVGLESLSPWSNTDGSYLRKKLGFTNNWIVYVDKPSMFYAIRPGVPGAYISVRPRSELCANRSLMVIRFDAQGDGTQTTAGALCSSPPANPVQTPSAS